MRQLQPLLWTKGTLLTPQHLQMQDRFAEDALQFRLESLAFATWGFLRWSIDAERLAAGVLALEYASGLFRDGLPFDMPAADNPPPDRTLASLFSPGQTSVDVYLGLPSLRQGGLNVALPGGPTDARYCAGMHTIRDDVSGAERPIQVASKMVRFLSSGEAKQGFSALRLCRIRRTPSGTFELDREFIPPLLSIAGSDYLMSLVRGLIENIGARSTELSAARRQKNAALADFTSSEIAAFWMLFAVNSHYPVLRHCVEVLRGHPETLYREMLSLAGALTAFSPDTHPRDLPVYEHDDLSGCFPALAAKLRLLLDVTVPRNFVAIRLSRTEPTLFCASIPEERLFAGTRMYLAIRADMNHGDLITRAPKSLRVGSASNIQNLVQHALNGVPLAHVSRTPALLPVKLDHEYFSLSQAGDIWASIAGARNIGVHVPAEFPGVEIELVILLPQVKTREPA